MNRPVSMKTILLFLLPLIPILAITLQISLYGGRLPYWDQWKTPGHDFELLLRNSLSFSDLLAQHNESRKAVTRSIWLGLGLNGWNVKNEMYLSVLLASTALLFVHLLVKTTVMRGTKIGYSLVLASSIILFNPYGLREGWLWGENVEYTLFILLLVAGVFVNIVVKDAASKYGLVVLISLCATYTFANGLLFWLLLSPSWYLLLSKTKVSRREHLVGSLGYILLFTLTIFVYFRSYHPPPWHPSPWESLNHPVGLVHFFLSWLGAPLSPPGSITTSTISGCVCVLLCVVAGVLIISGRSKHTSVSDFYPWLVLVAYGLITGAVVSAGRLEFGVASSGAPRYLMHVSIFYVGLLGGLGQLTMGDSIPKSRTRRRLLYASSAGACIALVLLQWHDGYNKHVRYPVERISRGETAIQFLNLVPENDDFHLLYPVRHVLVNRFRLLSQNGMLDFEIEPRWELIKTSEQTLRIEKDFGFQMGGAPSDPILVVRGWTKDEALWNRITHLMLARANEEDNVFLGVVSLRHFSRLKKDGYVVVDAQVGTQSLVDGPHRIEVFGYDALKKVLYETDWRFSFTKGSNEIKDTLYQDDSKVTTVVTGAVLDWINGRPVSAVDELSLTGVETIVFSGWAVEDKPGRPSQLAKNVFIRANGQFIRTTYHVERKDVFDFFLTPLYLHSGFYASVRVDELARADAIELQIVVETHDGEFLESARKWRLYPR